MQRRTMMSPLAATALMALGLAGNAYAERNISIVVPFAPGGNTDMVARMLAERLSPKLGATVIVENKPGGGAVVASSYVAHAAPDGNTLLLTTVAHAVTPALRKSLPYDSVADFTPLYVATRSPQILVAHNGIPANNMKELLALMRASPGKYSFGSSGTGSALHLAGELLRQQGGVKINHVPYRGTGQSINDVIAGHLDFIIDPVGTSVQFAKSGRVKALGITSPKRSPLLPDVPTFAESGLPGFEAYTWAALLGPKGMKPELAQRLNRAIQEVMNEPAFKAKLAESGTEAFPHMTLAEAQSFLREETKRWGEVIKASGIEQE